MKKTIAILLACAMLSVPMAACALADSMWVPEDNQDFFYDHSDQMRIEEQIYYANDESGYLEFFSEPDGDSLGFMRNAEKLYVEYTYDDDGELWGLATYAVGEDGYFVQGDEFGDNDGYVKMSGTTLIYDSGQFIDDYGPFAMVDADFSDLIATPGVLLWTYPGSGETVTGADGIDLDDSFTASYLYVDQYGDNWAYVQYFDGYTECWVDLTEPTNIDVPAFLAQNVDFYPTPTDPPEPSSSSSGSTTLIIILVCAVAAVSLVLILTLGRKKKKADGQ